MDVKIFPQKLDGVLEPVSDKIIALRAIMACALCKQGAKIYLNTFFDDAKFLIEDLKALGIFVSEKDKTFSFSFDALKKNTELNIKENSIALKFIIPFIAVNGLSTSIVGAGKAEKIGTTFGLIHGVGITNDTLPCSVLGKLKGGRINVNDYSHSQFISSLIMCLPLCDEDSVIVCDKSFLSKRYVKATLFVMKQFNIKFDINNEGIYIYKKQEYKIDHTFVVESDTINASYFVGANVFGNRIRVIGTNKESEIYKSKILESILEFNAKGTTLDLTSHGEDVFILAAASLFASSDTEIKNIEGIKKETIEYFCKALNKIGGRVEYKNGSIFIEGKGGVKGGEMVDVSVDGRIGMALSMIATVSDNPITVLSAESIEKYYHNFYNDFKKLGGKIRIV